MSEVQTSFKVHNGKETSATRKFKNLTFIRNILERDGFHEEPDSIDGDYLDHNEHSDDEGSDSNGGPGDDNDDSDDEILIEDDSGDEKNGNSSSVSFFIPVLPPTGVAGKNIKLPENARLRIHLKKHGLKTSIRKGTQNWASLNVQQLFHAEGLVIQYNFKVEASLEKKGDVKDAISFQSTQIFMKQQGPGSSFPNGVLKKRIVELKNYPAPKKGVAGVKASSSMSKRGSGTHMLVNISMTPTFIKARCGHDEKAINTAKAKNELNEALKNMITLKENYADIKIETKDEVSLRAHKFMLAARSSVLSDLIEAEVKKWGFKGTIKLQDTGADAMRVILHWIYTAELLEDDARKCMEEVLEGAVRFELVDLMKALDKKLITICNPNNAGRLYNALQGRKEEMPNAFEDISKFMKKTFVDADELD